MAAFDDDDDDAATDRFDDQDDDDSRAEPDESDRAPDDLGTTRCGQCRKFILKDAPQCPYCKHWQVEEEHGKKSAWFIVTTIVCIVLIGGGLVFGLFDILGRIR